MRRDPAAGPYHRPWTEHEAGANVVCRTDQEDIERSVASASWAPTRELTPAELVKDVVLLGRRRAALPRQLVPESQLVPVGRDLLLGLFGSFPTGLAIVTTLDETGAPKGLLCQAYIELSVNPPLMLIAVDKVSRTLTALQHHRAFVINFLNEDAADVARVFASKSDEKFRDVPWKPSPDAGGAPILPDFSTAFAACRVIKMAEAGDHWIFIASVEADAEIGGTPLIYWRRTYAAWPGKNPTSPAEGTG